MRLHFVLLVALIGFHSSCNVASATTEPKGISSDTAIQTSAERNAETGKRFPRKVDVDDESEDEERGMLDAVEKAAAKAKIPVWLGKKKTPGEVAAKLGMSGVYPLTEHKMWPVLKSYKKQYDKLFRSYP